MVVAVGLRRLHGTEILDLLARSNQSIARNGLVMVLTRRHQAELFYAARRRPAIATGQHLAGQLSAGADAQIHRADS